VASAHGLSAENAGLIARVTSGAKSAKLPTAKSDHMPAHALRGQFRPWLSARPHAKAGLTSSISVQTYTIALT